MDPNYLKEGVLAKTRLPVPSAEALLYITLNGSFHTLGDPNLDPQIS